MIFLSSFFLLFTICIPFSELLAQRSFLDDLRERALAGSDLASGASECSNPARFPDSNAYTEVAYLPLPAGLDGGSLALATASVGISGSTRAEAAVAVLRYQDIYSQTAIQVALSHAVTVAARTIAIGLRARTENLSFGPSFGHESGQSIDVGVSLPIDSSISAGFSVTNLVAIGTASQSRLTALGVAYRPIEVASIFAAVRTSSRIAADLAFGAELRLSPSLTIRAGTETAIGYLTAGLELKEASLRLTASVARHPELGVELGFGIGWQW